MMYAVILVAFIAFPCMASYDPNKGLYIELHTESAQNPELLCIKMDNPPLYFAEPNGVRDYIHHIDFSLSIYTDDL